MAPLTLLAQGAEARVFRSTFCGRDCIVKERFSKAYRHPTLDAVLTRRRLCYEARCIVKCIKLGVAVPTIFFVDESESKIYMEYVDAPTVRNVLMAQPDEAVKQQIVHAIGTTLAKLHAADIIHGDLTTSNMLWQDGKLIMIDFGLSYTSGQAEDKGVDLYVLERAFLSTHPNTESLFAEILNMYSKTNAKASKPVMAKLDEVRLRGRKRTMLG